MSAADFQQNYFELFGLPQSFDVDMPALASAYRQLQHKMHPDRYAAATERDRRLAVQYSSLINEAYESLRSPVKRAYYLLAQSGFQLDLQKTTSSDPEFLMQQMTLREHLSELRTAADPDQALEQMAAEIAEAIAQHGERFKALYQQGSLDNAAEEVAKMQFLFKLTEELEQIEAEILDYT